MNPLWLPFGNWKCAQCHKRHGKDFDAAKACCAEDEA